MTSGENGTGRTIVWSKAGDPPPSNSDGESHERRIKTELRQAGVTMFGRAKFASQHLPRVIHADERVMGAVYGRYRTGSGLLGFTEGMLVATDRRVLFLDYKPGYTAMEELPYDSVTGVQRIVAGPFSSVTLYTKLKDFVLYFANSTCVRRFVEHIESAQSNQPGEPAAAPNLPAADAAGRKALEFLRSHDLAVLSTVSSDGRPHGAAVHYVMDHDEVYILTKGDTQKAHNLLATRQAALTVYDAAKLQTVQLQGTAAIAAEPSAKNWAFTALASPRKYDGGQEAPPAVDLADGAFIVFRISPTAIHFSDFRLNFSS